MRVTSGLSKTVPLGWEARDAVVEVASAMGNGKDRGKWDGAGRTGRENEEGSSEDGSSYD